MQPPKIYWEYKAYDASESVHEGLVVTNTGNVAELAVMLRGKGLQLMEATKLNLSTFKALQRLKSMRDRIEPVLSQETRKTSNVFSNVLRYLLRIK